MIRQKNACCGCGTCGSGCGGPEGTCKGGRPAIVEGNR
ncbi:conserved hypothetical protein [delta proteobacterium NaphS2]|nr:conserved hypothetical protein [delta proteobacterium NaphS2]